MLKKLFLGICGLFALVLFWPQIAHQFNLKKSEITFKDAQEIAGLVTGLFKESSKVLDTAGTDISKQFESQHSVLEDHGKTVMDVVDSENGQAALTEAQGLIKGAIDGAKRLLTKEELAALKAAQENSQRARLADIQSTSSMIRDESEQGNQDSIIVGTLDKVLNQKLIFKSGSKTLDKSAQKLLDQVVDKIDNPEAASITVLAQELGKDGLNLVFKRTLSVVEYLREKGLNAQALSYDPDMRFSTINKNPNSQSFEIVVKTNSEQ